MFVAFLDVIALGLALICIFALGYFPTQSEDIFTYFAIAKLALEKGQIPEIDPFLYSVKDYPWHVFHEWGTYFIFYYLNKLGGFPWVTGFKALLIAATLGFPSFLALKRKQFNALIPLVTFLAAYAACHRFMERASLFSDVFTCIVLALLIQHSNATYKKIYGLVPLFLVWVNLHPGFPLGFLLIFFWMVAHLKEIKTKAFKSLAAATGLSLLACLANPLGYKGLIYPIVRVWSPEWAIFRKIIYEWQSPFISRFIGTWDFFIFCTIIGISILTLIWRRKQKPLFEGICIVFFTALGFSALRFVMAAAFALLLLVIHLATMSTSPSPSRIGPRPRLALSALCALGFFYLAANLASNGYTSISGYRPFQAGVDEHFFPVEALKVANRVAPQGVIFNDNAWGGYILWASGRQVFYHGHIDDPKILNNLYMETFRNQAAYEKVIKEFDIRFFLLFKHNFEPGVETTVNKYAVRPNWIPIYEDDHAVLIFRIE